MGLDSVELVMEAERLFNIELSDEEVEAVYTFGTFVDLVHTSSAKLGRAIERQEVEDTLRKLVCEHLSVEPEQVLHGSRFIEDLGMS
jgi:acyl carrier protein